MAYCQNPKATAPRSCFEMARDGAVLGDLGRVSTPNGSFGSKADIGADRLLDPRPDLRLASHTSNQAAAGDDCILVFDGAGPGENAIDVRDKHLALPHSWAHFAELAEKLRADKLGRAAACGIRLRLRIRPNYRPAPCLAAWMNADVNAVLRVAYNQVLADLLGEGSGGREEAGRSCPQVAILMKPRISRPASDGSIVMSIPLRGSDRRPTSGASADLWIARLLGQGEASG